MPSFTRLGRVCGDVGTAARNAGVRAAAVSRRITAPRSKNEDDRRREYILNVILVLSMSLFVILESVIVYNRYFVSRGGYIGVTPLEFALVMAAYGSLFYLSRRGRARTASYILIVFYAAAALYAGWIWGASLPATLLISAVVIVISGVLIGSGFGFIMTILMIAALAVMGAHESSVLVIPYWRLERITATDVITYGGAFLFMGFIAWLSNREIDRSLSRARRSEKTLEKERNLLEERVTKRTKELLESERSRTEELERVAKFGELSQGLFHDLMNPLQSISLSIEQLEGAGVSPAEARKVMDTAVMASRRMKSFMDSVKRSLESRQSKEQFSSQGSSTERADVAKELLIARDILAYKARMAGVEIVIERADRAVVNSHPVRIHQLLVNLLANAIESYDHSDVAAPADEKPVRVSVIGKPGKTVITVGDRGRGMTRETVGKIFDRSFSTKDRRIGIGLSTVKDVVEKDLRGTISVESTPGSGTIFTVIIPGRQDDKSTSNKLIDRKSAPSDAADHP